MNDPKEPHKTNGAEQGVPAPNSGGRRSKTRAEERIEALDAVPPTPAEPDTGALHEEIAELQARAETAEAERDSIRSQWQRTAADFANYKRRSEEDRFRELGLASEGLLRRVLAVADDLARALEHVPAQDQGSPWVEGIAAIERKVAALLVAEGVTPIEAVGTTFDPRQHEAVTMEPTSEVPEGMVTRELQRGYQIRDRVLRPALVVVSTAP
jgi:molecular chaperone GrpE